jgi:arylsulfatase A
MPPDRPNVVMVFTDDQGYGDLGCFGSPYIRTPNVDRLAEEGARFTDFHAATVCTPSRAQLMTGSYAARVGLAPTDRDDSIDSVVLFPGDEEGLHPDEVTIAEALSAAGYTTGCIGKWHLGDHHPFLPTDHGFDSYLGVPYSNDMRPDNIHGGDGGPPLPLVEDEEVIETGLDQHGLTERYNDAAVKFIEQHATEEEPFFCYLAHSMPHVPLHASPDFEGTSDRGLYGDVLEEVDHGVGRIDEALKRAGVADDTIVIYTSDNGPWLQFGHEGGSAGPLRGGKKDAYEGGTRVPCVVRWPDRVPRNTTCTELATTMDLLPTLAELAGPDAVDAVPNDRIDGVDIRPLLSDPMGATTPREGFAYYDHSGELRAIRGSENLKYYPDEDELYNLREDVGEQVDVSDDQPEDVERLITRFEAHREDIAANARPVGRDPGPGVAERIDE